MIRGTLNVNRYLRSMSQIHETQRRLTSLIFSGVREHFPGLMLVAAENDIGWVAHFLQRANFMCKKFRHSRI